MKVHRKLKGFLAAATMSIALTAAPSHALVINFFNGADLYATMTTTSVTNFDLHFVGQGVASTGFINELFMDGPNGTFTNTGTQTTADGTYVPNGFNGGGGQGKIYDWKISFPTANNDPDRLTIGEHAQWTIFFTNPDGWFTNKIHINAFDAARNSIKLDGCVAGTAGCGSTQIPEPSSLALLAIGLLSLCVGLRRRSA